MKKIQKLFVIKKYVMADSALDAIKKDKDLPVDDVWIDADWQKENMSKTGIGFNN